MPKVRVPVANTVGKSVLIDTNGTSGAQIGVNLRLPDGSVPSLAELANTLGALPAVSAQQQWPPTLWNRVLYVPPVLDSLSDMTDPDEDAIPYWDDTLGVMDWLAQIPDAFLTESSVTQHEAALTILETQITDGDLLARVGEAETITGEWVFDGASVTFTTGNIIAGTVDADFDDITATSYGGILEANLLDKTATETISAVWVHTDTLAINDASGAAIVQLRANGVFDASQIFQAPNGDFFLRPNLTITDRDVIFDVSQDRWEVDADFWVGGGFVAVGQVLADTLKLGVNLSGNELDIELQASANIGAEQDLNFFIDTDDNQTDRHFNWYHNGTGITPATRLMSLGDTGDLTIRNGSGGTEFIVDVTNALLDVRSGNALRIRNAGNTDFADFSHDGTDFNITGTNTTDINITGITSIKADASLLLLERAAAEVDAAGYGQVWVRNDDPCQLWYTDDGGVDKRLDYHQLSIAFHADVGAAGGTLTNHPASEQFLLNSVNRPYQKADLTHYTQVRLLARVITGSASANSPRIYIDYATSFSTTLGNYITIGASEVSCSLSSAGFIDSGWIDLVAGAKADVFLALKQNGGDGAADPAVGNITAQFR